MAYLVNQTNGTLLATVLDGAVDRYHAGIALIGKQVTNYGEIQNENFVRMTENFSSADSPANPLEGQLWWNSTTKMLYIYNGTAWVNTSPRISIPTSPIGMSGDIPGMMAVDASYLYVCTAAYTGTTNIWTRTALSTTW
jgi:hypothetical protein